MGLLKRWKKETDEGLHMSKLGDGLRKHNAAIAENAVMTEQRICQTPDEALLAAILSNLWAKMEPSLDDEEAVIRGLSLGRRRLYAIYAVTGDLQRMDFEALSGSKDGVWLSPCEEALQALGAEQCAALLRARKRDEYLMRFDEDELMAQMVRYIREHMAEFVDK